MDFLGWLYFKNYGRDTFAVYPVNSTNLVAEVQGETNARLISKAPEMYQALFYANQTIKATIEYMKTKKFITEDLVAIGGGFMEVTPEQITILADSAELPEGIDVDRAKAAMKRAEERIAEYKRATKDSLIDINRANKALARAKARLLVKNVPFN